MLSPSVQSLFGIQRPRPRRFPFYWDKHVRFEQRDPADGKCIRDSTSGKTLNSADPLGHVADICCCIKRCDIPPDSYIGSFDSVVFPTTCIHNASVLSPLNADWTGYKINSLALSGDHCFTRQTWWSGGGSLYLATAAGDATSYTGIVESCAECGGYSMCETEHADSVQMGMIVGQPSAGVCAVYIAWAYPYDTINGSPVGLLNGARRDLPWNDPAQPGPPGNSTLTPVYYYAGTPIVIPSGGMTSAMANPMGYFTGFMQNNIGGSSACTAPPGTWTGTLPNPVSGGCNRGGADLPLTSDEIAIGGTLIVHDTRCP